MQDKPQIRRGSLWSYVRFVISKLIDHNADNLDNDMTTAMILVQESSSLLFAAIHDISKDENVKDWLERNATAINSLQNKIEKSIKSGDLIIYDSQTHLRILPDELPEDLSRQYVRFDGLENWAKNRGLEIKALPPHLLTEGQVRIKRPEYQGKLERWEDGYKEELQNYENECQQLRADSDTTEKEVNGKSLSSFQNIIGALCDMYWREKYPDNPKIKQSEIIDELLKYDYPGMKERNLKTQLSKGIKAIRNE